MSENTEHSPASKTARYGLLIFLALLLIMMLFGLNDALGPLCAAFIFAYLSFPVVRLLEKRGISRILATSGVFVVGTLVLMTVGALILPKVYREAIEFLSELPRNINFALQRIETIAADNGYDVSLDRATLFAYLKEISGKLSLETVKAISAFINHSFSGVVNMLLSIMNVFLFPLFYFFIVLDFEAYKREIQNWVPKHLQPVFSRLGNQSNEVFSGYIRGQLIVALILGVLYAIGLQAIGLKFGLVIGLLSGLVSIIPYAGLAIGIVASIIVSLAQFSGWGQIFGIFAVFGVVQSLEGMIITPKVVGDKVGLNSLQTVLILIVGGNLGGLVGMVLAIPFGGVLKRIYLDLRWPYLRAHS